MSVGHYKGIFLSFPFSSMVVDELNFSPAASHVWSCYDCQPRGRVQRVLRACVWCVRCMFWHSRQTQTRIPPCQATSVSKRALLTQLNLGRQFLLRFLVRAVPRSRGGKGRLMDRGLHTHLMATTRRIRPMWISLRLLRKMLFVDGFLHVRSLFVARVLSRHGRDVPGVLSCTRRITEYGSYHTRFEGWCNTNGREMTLATYRWMAR
jgi:hypothetical protein